MKELANEVENTVAMVRIYSRCKEVMVDLVQQEFPLLHPCFYPCPVEFWTSLQFGKASIMEVNTH